MSSQVAPTATAKGPPQASPAVDQVHGMNNPSTSRNTAYFSPTAKWSCRAPAFLWAIPTTPLTRSRLPVPSQDSRNAPGFVAARPRKPSRNVQLMPNEGAAQSPGGTTRAAPPRRESTAADEEDARRRRDAAQCLYTANTPFLGDPRGPSLRVRIKKAAPGGFGMTGTLDLRALGNEDGNSQAVRRVRFALRANGMQEGATAVRRLTTLLLQFSVQHDGWETSKCEMYQSRWTFNNEDTFAFNEGPDSVAFAVDLVVTDKHGMKHVKKLESAMYNSHNKSALDDFASKLAAPSGRPANKQGRNSLKRQPSISVSIKNSVAGSGLFSSRTDVGGSMKKIGSGSMKQRGSFQAPPPSMTQEEIKVLAKRWKRHYVSSNNLLYMQEVRPFFYRNKRHRAKRRAYKRPHARWLRAARRRADAGTHWARSAAVAAPMHLLLLAGLGLVFFSMARVVERVADMCAAGAALAPGRPWTRAGVPVPRAVFLGGYAVALAVPFLLSWAYLVHYILTKRWRREARERKFAARKKKGKGKKKEKKKGAAALALVRALGWARSACTAAGLLLLPALLDALLVARHLVGALSLGHVNVLVCFNSESRGLIASYEAARRFSYGLLGAPVVAALNVLWGVAGQPEGADMGADLVRELWLPAAVLAWTVVELWGRSVANTTTLRGLVDDLRQSQHNHPVHVVMKSMVDELHVAGHISQYQLQEVCNAVAQSTAVLSLHFEDTGVRDNGVDAVASALELNKSVKLCYLWRNGVHAMGAARLADALRVNTSLWVLELNGNHLDNVACGALASALKENATLRVLVLDDNPDISDDGAMALAGALGENKGLRELSIALAYIHDAGAKAFADALTACGDASSLRQLTLSGNYIEAEGAIALCTMLKTNETLEALNIEFNPFDDSDEAWDTIQALDSETCTLTY